MSWWVWKEATPPPRQLLNTVSNGYRRKERRNCNDAIWNGFKPFRRRRNEFSRRLRGKFPAGGQFRAEEGEKKKNRRGG